MLPSTKGWMLLSTTIIVQVVMGNASAWAGYTHSWSRAMVQALLVTYNIINVVLPILAIRFFSRSQKGFSFWCKALLSIGIIIVGYYVFVAMLFVGYKPIGGL